MSKLRYLAAVVLLSLTTTVFAAPRVPPSDDPSFLGRIHRIVLRIVHSLDDAKLSPPIP